MRSRQESFTVSRPPTLDLRVPSGNLEVRAEGDDRVTVTIEGRHADQFVVEQSSTTIMVHHEGRRSLGNSSHQVTVVTPVGSRLIVRAASADLVTEGEFGDVELASASGDARLGSVIGGLDAKTASGRLHVEMSQGPVRSRTASGKVNVLAAEREVSIVTASGDVTIGDAGDDVTVKTASGRVKVERFDGGLCNVKTVSGGVRVAVPTERTVRVDLSSLSGRIDLPSEPIDGSGASRELRVRARTVSGNVKIETVVDPV